MSTLPAAPKLATAEGQEALHCLVVWARSKVFQGAEQPRP